MTYLYLAMTYTQVNENLVHANRMLRCQMQVVFILRSLLSLFLLSSYYFDFCLRSYLSEISPFSSTVQLTTINNAERN